ncbi:MAG TPA: metal ABC transporter permease [Firmicutes bacterium]|nr:metal ABC transporter permease [Bacillota bacterium]
MLTFCLDEEQALAAGLPVRCLRAVLVIAVAVTVVVSVKVVGVILASAVPVVPGATGARLARDLRSLLLHSVLWGPAACLLGMGASLRWDIPTGPGIVLVATAAFLLAILIDRLRA